MFKEKVRMCLSVCSSSALMTSRSCPAMKVLIERYSWLMVWFSSRPLRMATPSSLRAKDCRVRASDSASRSVMRSDSRLAWDTMMVGTPREELSR